MKKLIHLIILSISPLFLFAQIDVAPPNGNVGIGIVNPVRKLDVNGNTTVRGNLFFLGQDAGSAGVFHKIGRFRSASGNAILDLTGSTNYANFGVRVANTGAGTSYMLHRGTRPLYIWGRESSNIYFRTSNTNRIAIKPDRRVGIGVNNPNGSTRLHVNGSIGLAVFILRIFKWNKCLQF